MRRKHVIIRVGAILTVLGLVAVGCTGPGRHGQAVSDLPGPPAAVSTRTIAPSDRTGGTLRVVATADCDSWDPQRTAAIRCWNQQRWISRQLLTYPAGAGAGKLAGDLATDVPTSKDLRTWTYTLREGLAFEDGTPITSRDIKYGIERVFATDVITGGPAEAVHLLTDDTSPYPGPYQDPAPDRLGLTSIQTPDDRTITFRLNRPFADWNLVMAAPVSTPVPRAHDTAAEYGARPVASGPYRIEQYRPGESITLVRNPRWSPQTDPNRSAYPDRIVERMGLAPADIDNRILTDQADVSGDQTGVGAQTAARIVANPSLRAGRTVEAPTGILRYLAVVTTVAPFTDVHCRTAVAWALDKRAQQTARGGPVIGGDIAATMLTPPVRYYSWFDLFPSAGGTGDLSRARQELAACGRPTGFATTLTTGPDPLDVAQAEAVRTALARVGVTVTVSVATDPRNPPAMTRTPGPYGLALTARRGTWPTPYALLAPLADGGQFLARTTVNVAGRDQPTVNADIDRGIRTTDDDDAAGVWTALDRALVASGVYLPLLYDRALNVYSDRLTNIRYSPAFMMVDLAALGVVP
jgi:peptide/nickel transport system substrate-binding protein